MTGPICQALGRGGQGSEARPEFTESLRPTWDTCNIVFLKVEEGVSAIRFNLKSYTSKINLWCYKKGRQAA